MCEIFLPMMVAFVICLILGPFFIPLFRKLKFGNTEREYIESHKAKNGTPSMGGVMILIAFSVVGIFCSKNNSHVIPILVVTLAFGLIGFIDDYLKAVKKKSDGLIAWQKMLLQVVVSIAFAIYMYKFSDVSLEMRVPISGNYVDFGFWGIIILLIAMLGTVNGSNFTDGLDGLETSVTLAISGFLCVAALLLDKTIVSLICGMIGALFGFLMYNVHPAKVFMGDTGSLSLGGFVVATAYMLKLPLFIIIIALIYLVEVLSVIIQVSYFKITHGKRIFKMAPIHHHFELEGWSEVKVVAVFTTVTILLCVFAFFLL